MTPLSLSSHSSFSPAEIKQAWMSLAPQHDPLFMNLAWKKGWWDAWGKSTGGSLQLLLLQDHQGPLALAPVYIDQVSTPRANCPLYRRLQFVGCSYSGISTPRAEYNSLLLRREQEQLAARELIRSLATLPWGESVFEDMISGGATEQSIRQEALSRGWMLREISREPTYAIDTQGDFQAYLATLGANTRLKLYNRRKLLESQGELRQRNMFPSQTGEFFELLNRFHTQRWGQPCYGSQSLAFNMKLLEELQQTPNTLIELSLLELSGKPLSVMYNITVGDRLYNLQSGYLEDFHSKLSLGTLHLGYAIESAFNRSSTHTFDLLAGRGKQANYKRQIAREERVLVSWKIVRSPVLKVLYILKDHLKGRAVPASLG